MDTVSDRKDSLVTLLVVLGPLLWTRVAVVVCSFGGVVLSFVNQAFLLGGCGSCLLESVMMQKPTDVVQNDWDFRCSSCHSSE